jgi:hypothetical protein
MNCQPAAATNWRTGPMLATSDKTSQEKIVTWEWLNATDNTPVVRKAALNATLTKYYPKTRES